MAAAGAQGNLVLRIEPASGRVVAAIPISNRPFDVAVGDGHVWIVGGWTETLGDRSGAVWRIDPRTNTVVASLTLPGRASLPQVATGIRSVWVTGDDVFRIDSATNLITDTIEGGSRLLGIAIGRGSVWVADRVTSSVNRIDPAANQVTQTIEIPGGCGCSVAVGAGSVWAG